MRKLLAVFIVLFSASCLADTVTWTLTDVHFDDGGIATGQIILTTDAANKLTFTYNISTSGGDEQTFAPVAYQTGEPVQGLNSTHFAAGNGTRFISLEILPQIGNEIGIGASSVECFNCNPYRMVTSGYLVSDGEINLPSVLPEPGTLGMLSAGLGLFGWRRRFSSTVP